MKIGVISDTHDHLRLLDKAVAYFNDLKIDLLIHCGDWSAPFTMRNFSKANFPVKGVLGNNDPDIQKFQYQLEHIDVLKEVDIDIQPEMQDFTFDGKRICVFHGDDKQVNELIIKSQVFDLYCYGHTHNAFIKREEKTLVVNPGAFVGYDVKEGQIPRSVVIYDTKNDKVEFVDLDKLPLI